MLVAISLTSIFLLISTSTLVQFHRYYLKSIQDQQIINSLISLESRLRQEFSECDSILGDNNKITIYNPRYIGNTTFNSYNIISSRDCLFSDTLIINTDSIEISYLKRNIVSSINISINYNGSPFNIFIIKDYSEISLYKFDN